MRIVLAFAGMAILSIGFIATGLATENAPTVNDFLAICAQGDAVQTMDGHIRCMNPITKGFANGRAAHDVCDYQHAMPDTARLAVTQWLSNHPELSNRGEDDGIRIALRALYPCR